MQIAEIEEIKRTQLTITRLRDIIKTPINKIGKLNAEAIMKHGIIYFLRLSNVIWGIRFSIIPLIIIGINAPIKGALFPVAWGLCAVAMVVSFCTIAIKPPSDESVKKAIGKHRSTFETKA